MTTADTPGFTIPMPDGTARRIGADAQPFVIAEIGTNWHLGDAHDVGPGAKLIEGAAKAGCDAVKFQTFTPDQVYVPNPGESDYLSEAGIKRTITEVIGERVMPREMIARFAEIAAANGVAFMSSCFSVEEIELIDPLTPIHKLASYEISHLRLIDRLARTGKPLILSTGASDLADVDWAVERYRAGGGRDLAVLQCTARYPTPDEAVNLRAIPMLGARFGAVPGLSDHTPDALHAPFGAAALGAAVIEKHVTLDRALDGPDHFNSIELDELARMVRGVRAVRAMRGDGEKRVAPCEEELFAFARRRVQAIRPIAAGDILREGLNIAILRPGKRSPGAHPRAIETFEGRAATRAIDLGEGVTADAVEGAPKGVA